MFQGTFAVLLVGAGLLVAAIVVLLWYSGRAGD